MKNKYKVSIIVPFYNSKKTIEKCVLSILNQTYTNLEVLLVSDGGIDGSYEICEKFAQKDSRVKVIDKVHSGVSATRNEGLKVCTGDFVQFVDSDDFIEPTMIKKMLDKSLKYKADVVVCNYEHPILKNYLGDCVLNLNKKEDLLRYCQATFAMVVPWNKLYKRTAITVPFDETVHFTEDDLFALENLKNVKKVVSISDSLYHYYVAPNCNPEEASCIVKMALDPNFYKNENTYWYQRTLLVDKTLPHLNEFLDEQTAQECAYSRVFDFMIWEIIIMVQMGCNRDSMIKEVKKIFFDERFRYSIHLKSKYGLSIKALDKAEAYEKIENYCRRCFRICDKSNTIPNFKTFNACLYAFIDAFMETTGKIIPQDMITKAYVELHKNDELTNDEISYDGLDESLDLETEKSGVVYNR